MLNTLTKSLIGAAAALTVAGTSLTHAEEQAPVLLVQFQLDAEDPSGQALTAFFAKFYQARFPTKVIRAPSTSYPKKIQVKSCS